MFWFTKKKILDPYTQAKKRAKKLLQHTIFVERNKQEKPLTELNRVQNEIFNILWNENTVNDVLTALKKTESVFEEEQRELLSQGTNIKKNVFAYSWKGELVQKEKLEELLDTTLNELDKLQEDETSLVKDAQSLIAITKCHFKNVLENMRKDAAAYIKLMSLGILFCVEAYLNYQIIRNSLDPENDQSIIIIGISITVATIIGISMTVAFLLLFELIIFIVGSNIKLKEEMQNDRWQKIFMFCCILVGLMLVLILFFFAGGKLDGETATNFLRPLISLCFTITIAIGFHFYLYKKHGLYFLPTFPTLLILPLVILWLLFLQLIIRILRKIYTPKNAAMKALERDILSLNRLIQKAEKQTQFLNKEKQKALDDCDARLASIRNKKQRIYLWWSNKFDIRRGSDDGVQEVYTDTGVPPLPSH